MNKGRFYRSEDKGLSKEPFFLKYIKGNNNTKVFISFLIPVLILIIVTAVLCTAQNCDVTTDLPERNEINTTYHPEIKAFANANNIDYSEYPQNLIELLYRNHETRNFVLNYPLLKNEKQEIDLSQYSTDTVPLFMQWDTRWGYIKYGNDLAGITACGPVCLSMVAYYLTGDENYSPDKMIEFAKRSGYCVYGNGTSWKLFSKGAVDLGFDVTEIGLDEGRILKNLELGNPIVAIMGEGDFTTSGHFIVFAATEDGLIKVNDPNSKANSNKLWDFEDIKDQIRNLWVIRNKQE